MVNRVKVKDLMVQVLMVNRVKVKDLMVQVLMVNRVKVKDLMVCRQVVQQETPCRRRELRNRPQTALNLDLLHQQDSADWQIIFLINSLSNKSIY
jgi:hypothetical protein